MVDDVFQVSLKEARVQSVTYGSQPHYAIPGFYVSVCVPSHSGYSVARSAPGLTTPRLSLLLLTRIAHMHALSRTRAQRLHPHTHFPAHKRVACLRICMHARTLTCTCSCAPYTRRPPCKDVQTRMHNHRHTFVHMHALSCDRVQTIAHPYTDLGTHASAHTCEDACTVEHATLTPMPTYFVSACALMHAHVLQRKGVDCGVCTDSALSRSKPSYTVPPAHVWRSHRHVEGVRGKRQSPTGDPCCCPPQIT